ncbi:MAG TPA: sulfite exporter TauE/SafE family protein [Solirubrobacterales bacterium]|jgi:hypothetical protein|nr:sulfite exporter TauE/SafE family protein [Solirubrobacterales bacterium]
MPPLEALIVLAAAIAAGAANAVVGSGSLLTFPILLAVGLSPLTANVTNTVGLCWGDLGAIWGYRAELEGEARRGGLLAATTAAGALGGAALLLSLPSSVFKSVVPVLILGSCALLAIEPKGRVHAMPPRARTLTLGVLAFVTGLYCGFFGASAGVIVIGTLRHLLAEPLRRLSGFKNLMVGAADGVAALIFVFFAHIAVTAAGLIAVGSTVGALVGAAYGRRIPEEPLRWTVIAIGLVGAIVLFLE